MRTLARFVLPLVWLTGCMGSDPYLRLARELAAPLGPSRIRVAVLPFRGLEASLSGEADAATERIVSRLYGQPGVDLVERARLQQMLQEMRLDATGAVDPKTAQALGRLLGADAVVVGSVVPSDGRLTLEARLVEVATARVLSVAHGTVPRSGVAGTPVAVGVQRPSTIVVQPSTAANTFSDVSRRSPVLGSDFGSGDRLPWKVGGTAAAAAKERVFVIGGGRPGAASGRGSADVVSASILAGGRLGRWRAEEPLPDGRYQASAVVWKDFVFLVGGYQGFPRREVFVTKAGDDGRISAWRTAGNLPCGCTQASAVTTGGRLYVTGCSDVSGIVPQLYGAPIESDGALGPWASTLLSGGATGVALAVAAQRLFLAGGTLGGESLKTEVLSAQIYADGSLSELVRAGDLPHPLATFGLLGDGRRLWVFGGGDGRGFWSGVCSADVVERKGLSQWDCARHLSVARAVKNPLVYHGRFYVLGGESGDGATDVVDVIPAY